MANPKHLEILKAGVEAWNAWRKKNPEIIPNLKDAVLGGIDLFGADLMDADLARANLNQANLARADLGGVRLHGTFLEGANLTGAWVFDSDLTEANLVNANLTGALLHYANFSHAQLHDTILNQTHLEFTHFTFTSLKRAEGLETCHHHSRSAIDYQTLIDSGPLPDVFLKGVGLPDDFIAHLRAAWCNPIEFYSCFISYSDADKSFARRLHDTLQGRGIRCWLDEHQVLPGDKIHRVVDEGIRLWDKVLLCASESSLGPKGWWVNHELEKALKKEEQLSRERGQEVLAIIPLNLDDFVFRPDWQDWKKDILTTRAAPDFTDWKKDDDKFNAQIDKVIQALRADGGGRGHPPQPRL